MICFKKTFLFYFFQLFFSIYSYTAFTQSTLGNYYLEFRPGLIVSFGPSEKYAQIKGGFNEHTNDNKNQYAVGFREGFLAEIAVGRHFKYFDLQGIIGYTKQDIGLVENIYGNQTSFIISNELLLKTVVLFDFDQNRFKGLKSGVFISAFLPLSSEMNENIKTQFDFKDYQTSVQFNWGVDVQYDLPLGKKGMYLISGLSLTFPGIVGQKGKLELNETSSYEVVQDKIKAYSGSGFLGFGYRFRMNSESTNQ